MAVAEYVKLPFDGWYHCEMTTIDTRTHYSAQMGKSSNLPFFRAQYDHANDETRRLDATTGYECGQFQLPLCHNEVCNDSRNQTIQVFVKRKLANPAKVEIGKEKVLWVLQGGPGDSSIAMETLMANLYFEMNETVTLYTMDHRGTGRSSRLECNAAASMTSGSPGGFSITTQEYPDCIRNILFQVQNHTEAYSVTSAAYDVKKIIESSQASKEVYVYALSYGTFLVERLMQLDSREIKGYIVDSIVSQSSSSFKTMSTFSNWDRDVAIVGNRFLDYCQNDTYCGSKFNNKNITQLAWELYDKLDREYGQNKNECADLMMQVGGNPSQTLRSLFGTMIMSQMYREMIPPLIYRFNRCAPKDVKVLQSFIDIYIREEGRWAAKSSEEDQTMYYSELLYGLIVYSEMWETPTPSEKELKDLYNAGLMGGVTYALVEQYCTFTGSKDPNCAQYHLPHSLPFTYKRDKYWNATANVPEGATALLMSGGLDPQTERRYARAQNASMNGKHRLVEFPYAAHCTTFTTRMQSGGNTCGVRILASYVLNGGDVDAIDTSCQSEIIPLSFTGLGAGWLRYFGVQDPFEDDDAADVFTTVQSSGAINDNDWNINSSLSLAIACIAVAVGGVALILAIRSTRHPTKQNKEQSESKQADEEADEELTTPPENEPTVVSTKQEVYIV
ncbi:serine protease family S33 [Thraustotheca clavata]|uniref:Serine protease family S33 n=1 Tax=Thraustotheca clavata TaxID=74557 RepID=A0A1V9ZRB2_9STRA|nr:serine protease family S33 [Thraustotheca clavata]